MEEGQSRVLGCRLGDVAKEMGQVHERFRWWPAASLVLLFLFFFFTGAHVIGGKRCRCRSRRKRRCKRDWKRGSKESTFYEFEKYPSLSRSLNSLSVNELPTHLHEKSCLRMCLLWIGFEKCFHE